MLLIIDTSSKKSLIVKISGNSFNKKIFGTEFEHSERLLIEVSKNLGNKLSNLEGIAVISGPGSYTGLRVGIATANALSYSLNIPIIGINKLEWLASLAMGEKNDLEICSVVSAIHDSVYAGYYSSKKEKLEQDGDFYVGKIKGILSRAKKPTIFIVEDSKILRDIVNNNYLKNKLGSNFGGIKYYGFYSQSSIEKLKSICLEKIKKAPKGKIVKPLYIQKPNITKTKNN